MHKVLFFFCKVKTVELSLAWTSKHLGQGVGKGYLFIFFVLFSIFMPSNIACFYFYSRYYLIIGSGTCLKLYAFFAMVMDSEAMLVIMT